MAAMDPQLWAFLLVATLLAVTPGADTLLVARNVLGRGRTAGLATIAGIGGRLLRPRHASPRSGSR